MSVTRRMRSFPHHASLQSHRRRGLGVQSRRTCNAFSYWALASPYFPSSSSSEAYPKTMGSEHVALEVAVW